MSRHVPLDQLTVAELVQRFLSLTLGQYDAERRSEISKYNRLHGEMWTIRDELRRREGDQRPALLPFIDHENAQVRLMAASSLLTIVPDRAKRALETVRESQIVPNPSTRLFCSMGCRMDRSCRNNWRQSYDFQRLT